jgi:hypothetical protein
MLESTPAFPRMLRPFRLNPPLRRLFCGILAVIVGQIAVIAYHYWHVHYSSNSKIQKVKEEMDTRKTFWEDCASHLMQPEGFFLLGGYLAGTWMFRLMPASYYTWEGGVNPLHVFMQLVVNDCFQTIMHMGVSHLPSSQPVQVFAIALL